jgi:hypothetical protein
MRHNFTAPIVPMVTAIIIFAAAIVGGIATVSPDTLDAKQIVVFAAISAIAGWMTSAYLTRRNSTKQHTMTVLTQVRISTEMNSRIRALYDKLPADTPITKEFFTNKDNMEAVRAAQYILNYYEFLAVALRHGDLDHDLLKDCIRGQLCSVYQKLEAYIEESVATDPRQPSRRYSDLRKLYGFWRHG